MTRPHQRDEWMLYQFELDALIIEMHRRFLKIFKSRNSFWSRL